jgi:hypothetical protein
MPASTPAAMAGTRLRSSATSIVPFAKCLRADRMEVG